jgi:hypothetical protein
VVYSYFLDNFKIYLSHPYHIYIISSYQPIPLDFLVCHVNTTKKICINKGLSLSAPKRFLPFSPSCIHASWMFTVAMLAISYHPLSLGYLLWWCFSPWLKELIYSRLITRKFYMLLHGTCTYIGILGRGVVQRSYFCLFGASLVEAPYLQDSW